MDLPHPFPRCAGCPIALPICAGQLLRGFCDPSHEQIRDARSKYESSARGWPGIDAYEGPFAAEPVETPIEGAEEGPSTPQDATEPGRPTISTTKPRIALGTPQRPPADCVPCQAAALAATSPPQ
jgi:hypothetical protein